MTLGEKIKEARKQCGLSQEQLAEKMAVSRSAVAKWEANNGLPDVDNLKTLATLLNVSIDYLLDNGESLDNGIIREPYNLSDYGKGSKKNKKDRVIREKYPDALNIGVATKAEMTATDRVTIRASIMVVSRNRASYQRKEKPVQRPMDLLPLKENTISTKMGA